MTPRQFYAALAMNAYLVSFLTNKESFSFKDVAQFSFKIADIMIKLDENDD